MDRTIFLIFVLLLFSHPASADYNKELARAEKLYHRLHLSEARATYDEILESVPEENRDLTPIRFKALIGLALVEQAAKNSELATDLLHEAVDVAGWRSLSNLKYPPSFISKYQQIKMSQNKKLGAIAVSTDPPFAKLKVQGFDMGTSPITLQNLPVGKYHLTASLNGLQTTTEIVQVKAGEDRLFKLILEHPPTKIVEAKPLPKPKKMPKPLPVITTATVIQKPPKRVEKDEWWESTWVWGAALAVGGGIAIYYLTQKEDKGVVSIDLP